MLFSETISIKLVVEFLVLLFSSYILLQTILQRNINRNSNRFVLYLMVIFTTICLFSLASSVDNKWSKYFIFIYIPSFLFIAPTTFLYIKSLTTRQYIFTAKDKRHYIIPFVILAIMFIYNMLLLILRYNLDKESISSMVTFYLYMNIGFMLIVPVIQLFVYGILIIKSYRRHLSEIENYFSNTDEAKMLWIRWFIGVFIVYLIIFNVVNYSFQESWAIMDVLYYTDLFMFIGFLGIFGLKQADIYRMVSNSSTEISESETNEKLTPEPAIANSFQGSSATTGNIPFVLSDEKKDLIKQSLLEVMEEQKPYLNPMLTITELAELLNSNQKYLSVVINDCFDKNFFTFINEYRVKEAIKLLSTSVGQQYSIEGIGKTVGFNSRSTFISAFKKQTNTTPSEYKNM